MSKKTWDIHVVNVLQVFFMLVFFGAMIYFVQFYVCNPRDNFEEGVTYLETWDASSEGTDLGSVEIPCKLSVERGSAVSFETTLPNNLEDDYWLVTRNSKDIVVYVDGIQCFTWSRSDAVVPGEMSRAAFVYVPMKESYSGKKITILRGNPQSFNGSMGKVMIGDIYSVRQEIIRTRGGLQFFIALFIFSLSIILTIIGVFLKNHYRQKVYLVASSFGIMIASVWMLLDSDIFEVIFGIRYINGFLSYIMTFIMIYPFMFYVDGLQEGRFRKLYASLAIVETVNFITCLYLHLRNIVTFSILLPYMDGIIAIIAVIVMVCIIYDMAKGRATNYLYVAVGFLAFIVLCIIEIGFLNSGADRLEGNFILMGLFVLMIVSVVQQIEDIKKAQGIKQIEFESDMARTEFLVNMSHEIRTPINTILGMNEMIMQDSVSPAVKEYSERIQHSGQILMSLINDVLDYSRYQMEDETFVVKDYNVRRMLDVLVAVLKDGAEQKKLDANVVIPSDIPKYLKGDEQHISRVLSNIISNSIKYTNKGSISFTVVYENTDKGNFINFYIKDTGVGIKPEHLKTIFEPFARADIRNNRSVAGTGLGLAITKELVEKMGGTIEVMSIYGEGSSFRVRIPQEISDYVPDEADGDLMQNPGNSGDYSVSETDTRPVLHEDIGNEGARDELKDISASYKAPNAKILAVDDNNSNLIVISEFLKNIDAQIDTATGGEQAIMMANTKRYDIILMDHMMPEPDGVQAMHAIRESLESLNRRTPDIVLTANAIGNCREQYIKEGFDNYLSKPIERELLLKMIRKYINPKLIIETGEKEETAAGTEAAKETVANTDASKDTNAGSRAGLSDMFSKYTNNDIINLEELFARFENQESIVNMVLKETVREGEKKITLLRNCFEEGDIGRYAVESHGVKGVMASVCANKFSAHAKEHEFAAKRGDTDFIEGDLNSLLSEYRKVLDYIIDYLQEAGIEVKKPESKAADTKDSEVDSVIDEIMESLNDFDADRALSYVKTLEEMAGKEHQETVEKIRQYTDDFEYDKALECCEILRKQYEENSGS